MKDPKWYNSSSGWEGVTFVDSVNFCASHDRVPCPFDLDWDILEHEHVAGDITQNILCCLDVHRTGTLDPLTEWGADDLEDHVEGAITLEATSNTFLGLKDASSELKPDMDEQKRERTVIAAFHPIWFSKSHGWSGSSYEDGILFCESYNHMVLCPYAAYCPNGDGKQVLPGSLVRDIDGEQWVPANGPMNTVRNLSSIVHYWYPGESCSHAYILVSCMQVGPNWENRWRRANKMHIAS